MALWPRWKMPTCFLPRLKKRFRNEVLKFGRHFQHCCSVATKDGDLLWRFTPKVHLVQHLPSQAELVNPVMVQNYAEEGMIGRVTKVWRSCAHGSYMNGVQHTALLKALCALQILLEIRVYS